MTPGHAGTRIAHDGSDSVFCGRPKAMDWTNAARRLVLFESAFVNATIGVTQGPIAIRAKSCSGVVNTMTIHLDHD